MTPPAWVQTMQTRCADASKGPWECTVYGMHAGSPTEWRLHTGADSTTFDHQYDAEFCAHARTDVPALLALVEALAGALEDNQMRGGDDPCWCIEYNAELGHSPYCTRSREALARYAQGPGATTGGGDE